MNVSNTNFELSVDLTGQRIATTLQMPQTMLQPPPLVRRTTGSTMQVVDDDIVCIESDSEDTQINTPLYRDNLGGTTNPVTTIGTHLPNLSQGKIVTIRKNGRIYKIMIPRNVIPNVSNSPCPVTLNVPGIGPLKLKIDPFVKYNTVSSIPPTVNTVPPTLSPFSLNFDDIHRNFVYSNTGSGERKPCPSSKKRSVTTVTKDSIKKNSPTKAGKFCYVPNIGVINTFGFTHTECRQPKKCLSVLNAAIKKIKAALASKTQELKRLSIASGKNTQVKTVPISKIVGTDEVIDLSDSSDNESVCNSSLLVTKKVVILSDGKEYEKNIRKRRKSRARSKQPNKKPGRNIKPCYVTLTRDPYVEKVYRDTLSKLGNDVTKFFSKKKQNQPEAQAPPSINISKYVIDTEPKFKNHIAYIKPITVINEHNYRTIKSYKDEFCRTNIVYALKDRLPDFMARDADFISAVSDGYVKLIDDELLCSYFLRELGAHQ